MLESLPPMNYKLLGDVFPQASSEAIDLIRSCFHFNPNKRPSAEELLKVTTHMHEFEEAFQICVHTLLAAAADSVIPCKILIICKYLLSLFF